MKNNLHEQTEVLELHLYFITNRNQLVGRRRNHYISGLAPQEQWHISMNAAPK